MSCVFKNLKNLESRAMEHVHCFLLLLYCTNSANMFPTGSFRGSGSFLDLWKRQVGRARVGRAWVGHGLCWYKQFTSFEHPRGQRVGHHTTSHWYALMICSSMISMLLSGASHCMNCSWVVSCHHYAGVMHFTRCALCACTVQKNGSAMFTWFVWKMLTQVHSALL